MNDEQTTKILFILTILGILIITFLSQNQKPLISGEISNIRKTTKTIIIQLENQSKNIILFEKEIPLEFEKGEKIIVFGKEEEYNNKTQILASKIILITYDN